LQIRHFLSFAPYDYLPFFKLVIVDCNCVWVFSNQKERLSRHTFYSEHFVHFLPINISREFELSIFETTESLKMDRSIPILKNLRRYYHWNRSTVPCNFNNANIFSFSLCKRHFKRKTTKQTVLFFYHNSFFILPRKR